MYYQRLFSASMDKVRGMTALRRLEIFTLMMRIEPPTSRSADQRSNH